MQIGTVKPPIKDTPKLKKDNLPAKDNLKVHTPYKITSERGQPLCKGQKAGSRACPLFGGFTV